jgi:hypothetical protein
MSTASPAALDEFTWEVQPAAARWVAKRISEMSQRNSAIARLNTLLLEDTGTRLTDWVDHIALADDAGMLESELVEVKYAPDAGGEENVWRHPLGMFPPVVVGTGRVGIGIRCDSVDDCLAALPKALGISRPRDGDVLGERGGPYRDALLSNENGVSLCVVERHGYLGFDAPEVERGQVAAAARHLDAFRKRARHTATIEEGFEDVQNLFAAAADEIGRDWACDLFFQAEREYWQSRNTAARVQYERQNRLGLGWANHDHHTYRSSRQAFKYLIASLEQMGFHCRERFYAGNEAGWGAQVLEQPEARIVIFADVDMSAEELMGDFAHDGLVERDELGTVGLWCELHGEAFLSAGMHHLECQFSFDAAREQLAAKGTESMAPFTNFEFLRQSFTKGEIWPIEPRHIERLLSRGRITSEQAERFRKEGALGSHLEILERNDGYKGFNQTGVSDIIARTDPRRMVGA